MEVAICEDTVQDSRILCAYLERYRSEKQLDIDARLFESGEALLKAHNPGETQIIFMDVYLGDGLNGVETARRIREADPDCAIIFLTTSEEHAVEGFAVQAAHYLVKPVAYPEFTEAMARCERQIVRFAKYIEVMVNRQPVRIPLRDILYAEVFRKTCVIHTVTEDIPVNIALDALAGQLAAGSFLRCHKSYIVNLSRAEAMHKGEFTMENGSAALISKRMQASVERAYYDFTRRITDQSGAI